MPGPQKLETERLILRPPTLADAGAIAALLDDFEVVRWLSRVPWPYGEDDARYFLTEVAPKEHVWAIEARGGGLVGVIGFSPGEDAALDIGYWIGRRFWGQGYATEAGRAAIGHARAAWPEARLTARCFVGNDASARVLTKLGFIEVGRARTRTLALDAEVETMTLAFGG